MTPDRANSINIETETNVETLKELVQFWKELALKAEQRVGELQPSFSVEMLKINNQEKNKI